MDYEKESQLEQPTGEAIQWNNLTPERDLGSIGNKIITSQESPEAPAETPSNPIEIVDVAAPDSKNTIKEEAVFNDADIHPTKSDKISPATLSALHSIENQMSSNPAAALKNYQHARELYNKEESA